MSIAGVDESGENGTLWSRSLVWLELLDSNSPAMEICFPWKPVDIGDRDLASQVCSEVFSWLGQCSELAELRKPGKQFASALRGKSKIAA